MTLKESVFFISLHKCATSFFSRDVLNKVVGLEHIDYEGMIFRNEPIDKIEFVEFGYVYGVIRVNFAKVVYEKLIKYILKEKFLINKRTVFLVRDPRDILVSQYYSFGGSHVLSKNNEIKETQLESRRVIELQSIDDFVLVRANELKKRMNTLYQLINFKDHLVLKYEDMILDFDKFYSRLDNYIGLKNNVKINLFESTRPRKVEMENEHKRSGKVGGYIGKLESETIDKLNIIFNDLLERFDY